LHHSSSTFFKFSLSLLLEYGRKSLNLQNIASIHNILLQYSHLRKFTIVRPIYYFSFSSKCGLSRLSPPCLNEVEEISLNAPHRKSIQQAACLNFKRLIFCLGLGLGTHLFVNRYISTRRERSDLFGLRVMLPPVITSLTTQR